jgi:radical SAM superfamily enzyme YgiQ (UPF0313 family)
MESVIARRPDVVGFTAYTYTMPAVLEACRAVKEALPLARTVCGGYHPTACPEVVDSPYVDVVIRGEGDLAFPALLDTLRGGGDLCDIPGVVTKDSVSAGPPRLAPRITAPDDLPIALRDADLLRGSRILSLMYPPPSMQTGVAQVTYARGCPFDCVFCSKQEFLGSGVHYRSPAAVADEVEAIRGRYGINTFYFTDLTFNASRSRVKALCNEFIRRRLDINWFCNCRTDGPPDLYEGMRAAGCRKVGFGIERIDAGSLGFLKPRLSQDMEAMRAGVKAAGDAGLLTRGYLMIGLPDDSEGVLASYAHDLPDWPLDDIRIGFLTPYPGTAIAAKLSQSGIAASNDLATYTSEEPVLVLPRVSRDALLEWQGRIYRNFYRSQAFQRHVRDRKKAFPEYGPSFDEYGAFLRERGVV